MAHTMNSWAARASQSHLTPKDSRYLTESYHHHDAPLSKSRKNQSRVKSGCRTCKTRKVKCDEGRPACTKCVLSGRTCGGYGVWGGGNTYTPSTVISLSSSTLSTPGTTTAAATKEDIRLLDWFRFRTITKFQATYGSSFWDLLTVKTGLEEPAVFHAALALTSIQKRVVLGREGLTLTKLPDKQEHLTLGHYSKAIDHLVQPRFANPDGKAVRVALISCMIFITMECARGCFQAAATHLRNGMRLLGQWKEGVSWPGTYETGMHDNEEDGWVIEAFIRINFYAVQLGNGHWEVAAPYAALSKPLPVTFSTSLEAKGALDAIIADCIKVSEHIRHENIYTDIDVSSDHKKLENIKQHLQSTTEHWLTIFTSSHPLITTQIYGQNSKLGALLLLIFHDMTRIMASTCLAPDSPLAFDAHTFNFHAMLHHALQACFELKIVHADENPVQRAERELFYFFPDQGWLAALFYLTRNCRVRRLRMHAVRFMEAVPTREGMWDHHVTATLSRKLIDMEHGYIPLKKEEKFELVEIPDLEGLQEPNVPREKRWYDVRLEFRDDPKRSVVMSCKRDDTDGVTERFEKEYDLGYADDWFSREQVTLQKGEFNTR